MLGKKNLWPPHVWSPKPGHEALKSPLTAHARLAVHDLHDPDLFFELPKGPRPKRGKAG